MLNQSGNVITGSAGGTNYFTISINPATGQVTFTDNTANNMWHANTASDDDTADADIGERQPAEAGADGDGCRRRR